MDSKEFHVPVTPANPDQKPAGLDPVSNAGVSSYPEFGLYRMTRPSGHPQHHHMVEELISEFTNKGRNYDTVSPLF
jgi:hypothetical protein